LADAIYRTFIGFVKFEPKEAEAGGKQVRQIVLREAGIKEQALDVRATLWPSHENVAVEQGDAVLVEGKFTVNKAEDKTYFNLSVSRIVNLGPGDPGEREETTGGGANDSEDDDESY
jgi:hypothetical protein